MSLFSQRAGIRPAKKQIQLRSLDDETRNRLWSVIWRYLALWNELTIHGDYGWQNELLAVQTMIWGELLKQPLDRMPHPIQFRDVLRAQFFGSTWHEAFDLLDFIVQNTPGDRAEILKQEFNKVLEQENSAYRFVGGVLTEITTEPEIQAIDSALASSHTEVASHLQKALQFLSDRTAPDYHNSIKESVSALEACARRITGQPGATLSVALKSVELKGALHPALWQSLLSLYGYAGDEGGVRHANKAGGHPVTQAEARLILVVASAVCGYLTAKQPA